MANKLTVVSRDGTWKADLHAFKDNWLVYARIGSECHVYHRQQTKDTWGNTVVGWADATANISIQNTYKGGGLQIVRNGGANSNYASIFEYAYGFLVISINIDTGEVGGSVGAAKMVIDSVEAHIQVGVPGDVLSGVVIADTAIVQQSTW